jgi:hypothetical protein
MLEECTTGSNLSRKATLLMAEVMQMANRVLPLNVAAKIQVWAGIPFISTFLECEYVFRLFRAYSIWQRIITEESIG